LFSWTPSEVSLSLLERRFLFRLIVSLILDFSGFFRIELLSHLINFLPFSWEIRFSFHHMFLEGNLFLVFFVVLGEWIGCIYDPYFCLFISILSNVPLFFFVFTPYWTFSISPIPSMNSPKTNRIKLAWENETDRSKIWITFTLIS